MSIPQDSWAEPTTVHYVTPLVLFLGGKCWKLLIGFITPTLCGFTQLYLLNDANQLPSRPTSPHPHHYLMLPDCEQVCKMFSIMVLICFQPNPGSPSTGQSCFSRLKSVTHFYLSLSVSYRCAGLSYPFWTLALCQLNALQASPPRCGLLVPFIIYAALDEF